MYLGASGLHAIFGFLVFEHAKLIRAAFFV